MQLSLPASDLPGVDLPAAIRVAAGNRLGLELRAGRAAQVGVDLLFADAGTTRSLLTASGGSLAAVWMAVPPGRAADVAGELAAVVDAAAAAGCPLVCLAESRATPRAVLHAAGAAAARAGVRLAVGNWALQNGIADLWRRLDAIDHPSVGCYLDTLHAALGGDGPSVAVPTLASQIAHVRLRHPATDAETVHRLAGIGYAGHLSVSVAAADTVRSWLPNAARG